MKDKIRLEENLDYLQDSLIELNHNFLKKLIINASKSKEPCKNKEFALKICLNFNKGAQKAMGLYSLFNQNRAIKFFTLNKIVDFSKYCWADVEKNILSIRLGRRKGKVNHVFPVNLDKNLGKIIGHILGDGSIDRRYLQVFFTNQDKDLLLEFMYCMKCVFGINPRIWIQESGNFLIKSKWVKRIYELDEAEDNAQIGLFYPSICGLILNSILPNFAVGKEKCIPAKALNFPKDFQIGIVRAFFDDEGSVDMSRSLRFNNDNKQILVSIKGILSNLGVKSNPIRYYTKKGKKRHYFNICSYGNISYYYTKIGITSKKKKSKLMNLLKNAKRSKCPVEKYCPKNDVARKR